MDHGDGCACGGGVPGDMRRTWSPCHSARGRCARLLRGPPSPCLACTSGAAHALLLLLLLLLLMMMMVHPPFARPLTITTAALCGKQLEDVLPPNTYLEYFSPDYRLHSNRRPVRRCLVLGAWSVRPQMGGSCARPSKACGMPTRCLVTPRRLADLAQPE